MLSGCAVDRVAIAIMAVPTPAGERHPVSGLIFSPSTFHAVAQVRVSGWPRAAHDICAIYGRPAGVEKADGLTIVTQIPRIDLVGGDIGDGAVIGSLKEKETLGSDCALQVKLKIIAIRQEPPRQIEVFLRCVEQLDPLIA